LSRKITKNKLPRESPVEGLPGEFVFFSLLPKARDSLKNSLGDSLGTPWGVLIFGDSPGRIKVIPWGFTREFTFFKGLTGDFAGESRLGSFHPLLWTSVFLLFFSVTTR